MEEGSVGCIQSSENLACVYQRQERPNDLKPTRRENEDNTGDNLEHGDENVQNGNVRNENTQIGNTGNHNQMGFSGAID